MTACPAAPRGRLLRRSALHGVVAVVVTTAAFAFPVDRSASGAVDPAVSDDARSSSAAASARPTRVILNPTQRAHRSQAVTWRVGSASRRDAVRVVKRSGGSVRTVRATERDRLTVSDPRRRYVHRSAVVRGLRPDTAYRYRVGRPGAWSTWRTFRSASKRADGWEFLYFGDAQTGLRAAWADTVRAAFDEHAHARLMLQAGDLVDTGGDDDQWGNFHRAVRPWSRRVPLLTTPGNHEKRGDTELRHYRAHFRYPRNASDGQRDTAYFTDYGGVRFVSVNGNASVESQQRFLDAALADNPHRWSVVTMHQPVFSSSENRVSEKGVAWRRVIERHDVDLVLQGHDHVYARGHLKRHEPGRGHSGPVYATSVSGPKYYPPSADGGDWTSNDARLVVAAHETSTYQAIGVHRNRLTYRSFVTRKGSGSSTRAAVGAVMDSFTVLKRDGRKTVLNGIHKR